MKKKLLKFTALIITSAVIFTSCTKEATPTKEVTETTGTTEEGTTEEGTTAAKVVKVTKWGELAKAEDDTIYNLSEDFNSKNSDIQIKLDMIPGDGYGTKLTTSFASGDGYDVFLSGEGDFYKWVAQGVNQPIDDRLAADPTFNKDDFAESIFEMGKIDDKQYYLVTDTNPLILFFNTKLFDNAGLAYPDATTTWDTIFDDARKIANKDEKIYGFNSGSWGYALVTYIESTGARITDATATTADGYLNSDKTIDAVEKYFALTDEKVSPSSASLDELGGAEAMLANDKLAMFISGYWSSSTLADSNATYKTAIIPQSANGDRISCICAAGLTMSNTTKVPDEAYKVMRALTGVEAQQYAADHPVGALPTTKSTLDEKLQTMPEADKAVIDVIQYGVQPIGLRGPKGNTIMEEFGKAVEKIIQKQGTVKENLDEAVAKINAAE